MQRGVQADRKILALDSVCAGALGADEDPVKRAADDWAGVRALWLWRPRGRRPWSRSDCERAGEDEGEAVMKLHGRAWSS
jgi:hypothetical protein